MGLALLEAMAWPDSFNGLHISKVDIKCFILSLSRRSLLFPPDIGTL